MSLTTIDLFAGAGGITEGFRQVGARCLFANDFDAEAVRSFRLNHPETDVVAGPIEAIDPRRVRKGLCLGKGELDSLVGGPPCQGFSINAPGRLLDDPRNHLFRHYLKFVDEFAPKTLVFENVTGMLSLEKGKVFREVVNELESRGYFCEAKILFAAHYGVPQERWRLIILGSSVGLGISHPHPQFYLKRRANFSGGRSLVMPMDEALRVSLKPAVTVKEAIYDLPSPCLERDAVISLPERKHLSDFAIRMRGETKEVYNHVLPKLSPINIKRLDYIRPGGSWRDIPFELLPKGMQKARRSDHTKRYGRLHPDGLASTIMTKCDPHWGPVFHPEEKRSLTVREAARFQSFPDRYIFKGTRVSQYAQVGNAVPPLMASAICEAIQRHVDRTGLDVAV